MFEVLSATLGKCTIAIIQIIIIIFMKIVAYINIFPAIIIKVGNCNSKPVSQAALINICLCRNIGKLSLTVN